MMIRDVIQFNGCFDELLDTCVDMWEKLSPADKELISKKLNAIETV